MFDPMFVPPRHNPFLVWLCNATLPRLAPVFGNVYGVEVPDEDFGRLEALGTGRALLCPNHPTETDPIVAFWLSRKLGQSFNYLATRETLEGPRGWLLNRIGVYSVIRGFPDRESIRMTRRLLAEMDRKVVIFPEGQVYEHNDMLLDFQMGVAQIGFWALEDLAKAGREPALPLAPVAVRYRCRDDPAPAIERALKELEGALGIPRNPGVRRYDRLRQIGGRVLSTIEGEEGLKASDSGDLSERIRDVRRAALDRVAQAAGTRVNHEAPTAEALHQVFNELKAWVGVLEEDATEYDERRYRHRLQIAAPLFRELLRLQNVIVLSGDYVASEPSAERFLEVLRCLQKEVFGKIRHRAPLIASVRIAPVIRLEERRDAYRENKREVVASVTSELQTAIREQLDAMSLDATPIDLSE